MQIKVFSGLHSTKKSKVLRKAKDTTYIGKIWEKCGHSN